MTPATRNGASARGRVRRFLLRRSHGARVVSSTALAIAVALSIVLGSLPVAAFTTTTITIDGSFDDWIGVRADTDNVVRDTQIPDDPDYPGQPDRDVYLVGTTYDDEYLYFSWRRTAGGTKAITFGAYLDYEGDGLLQDTDRVVVWTVSTGGPYASYTNGGAMILKYNQARLDGALYHPEGDPMRDTHRTGVPSGDGETPDGWADKQSGEYVPQEIMDAYLSPNGDGIECEARVAWSDLGVEPGYPFAIHFAAGNGPAWGEKNKPSITYKSIGGGRYLEENRGQVEDNVEPIMYLLDRGVTISPDNADGGAPGEAITYSHTISNDGNTAETFDLAALTNLPGWTVSITDTAGNPISAVTLAADTTQDILVHVTIPTDAPSGTQAITTVTATSQSDPGVSDSATDTTRVGLVTVTPNQSGTMAPGQTISYVFDVQNNTGASGQFDLAVLSSLGWPYTITDMDDNPITSVLLGIDEMAQVKVNVTVPAGTSPGTQDVTRLTATLNGSPAVTSSATGTTTAAVGLTIEPDNTGYAGAGTTIQYTHTITNSWPTERDVTLSYASSQGWPVTFWEPDGVTQITGPIEVGANGATRDVIVRIAVPPGAATNAVDTTTVTATTVSGGTTYTETATDTTTVRRLTTYADGGYVNQADEFRIGDVVYSRATGLKPGDDVYFVWYGPDGQVRTSSLRTVDTQGMAFDEYTTLEGQPTGAWYVELYSSRDVLLERTPFTVTFDAEITELSATDAPGVGEDVAVSSSVVNNNTSTITDSTMTYVIWWDSNGDGTFGAGDIYIDDTGAPITWDGTSPVDPTHVTTGITVAGGNTWDEPMPWTVSNSLFPNQGTYRVTATWTTTGGTVIDEATTEFYSIPTLGLPLFALTMAGAAYVLWRRRTVAGGEAS